MGGTNVFLLAGPPRTGKSTAIKAIVRRIGATQCGGFFTEEIRSKTDREGFRIVTLGRVERLFAHVNSGSPLRVGRYGVELEALEQVAIPALLQSVATKPVTVVDELGPMQLLSAAFQERIRAMVSNRTSILLGTISQTGHPALDFIPSLANVKLYPVTMDNRDSVPEDVVRDLRCAMEER